MTGVAKFLKGAAPSTPSAGYVRVYAKTDGYIYGLDESGVETQLSNSASPSLDGLITHVRQTVDYGPVDANGFAAFGGSTGSTTVTAAGTLYLTAANGINNRRGSIDNPSWTGLSTNGTMYLYLDIASDGSCTTVSSTLAPVYQCGGTYSITNGQFTFNTQEMTGKVGNGTVATQTYRVAVGEVVVSGGLVASIVWYALNDKYFAPAGTNPNNSNAAVSLNHNIGKSNLIVQQQWVCNSTELGYAVGESINSLLNAGGTPVWTGTVGRLTVGYIANIGSLNACHKSTSTITSLTLAKWDYRPIIGRSW